SVSASTPPTVPAVLILDPTAAGRFLFRRSGHDDAVREDEETPTSLDDGTGGRARRGAARRSGDGGAARRPAGRRDLALAKASLREPPEQRLPARLLVVPGERDLAHQVRVRVLEPVLALERAREAHHAVLAADAADLDRLGLRRHRVQPSVRAAMSAAAAAAPTSSWRSASGCGGSWPSSSAASSRAETRRSPPPGWINSASSPACAAAQRFWR